MNLLPTFEQTSLAEALRDVLVDGSDDATVWRALSQDLGVAGIGIHEEHGGAGGSLADLSIVFTELGRAVAQDRLLPHVIGLRLLLGAGESGSDLLAQALAGDAVIAWSPRPASIQFDPTSGTATGTAAGVLGDADASVFLVPVDGPDGVAILAVAAGAPGLQVTAQTGLDLRRPEVRVDLANAPARALGNPELFAAIEPVAAVLLAASQLGGAARCLQDAVDYAKNRYQFGRAVGSFQAIKHRLADTLQQLHSAEIALRRTADLVGANAAEAVEMTALLQVVASETYTAAAHTSLQVHGGIGFTVEVDCHLHVRRAHASMQLLGRPETHRARLAHQLLDA